MKPTAPLCSRLKTRIRFTTKQVAKGFYRGTGVGSLGAHTQYGGYLIDYRKSRHFVVPDLTKVKLTPYVSGEEWRKTREQVGPDGEPYRNVDGLQYLKWWRSLNDTDFRLKLDEEQAMQGEEPVYIEEEPSAILQDLSSSHQEQEQPRTR